MKRAESSVGASQENVGQLERAFLDFSSKCGARMASFEVCKYVLLLNSDTTVRSNTVNGLHEELV